MTANIKHIVPTFLLALIILFSHTAHSQDISYITQDIKNIMPMSIKESYKAIPHEQTTYDMSKSPLSYAEKKYLSDFFTLSDLMMSARVSTLTNLYHSKGGMSINTYNEAFQLSMEGFQSLDVPKNALPAHKLIVQAIQEHHKFLNNWSKAPATEKARIKKSFFQDALVKSSSSKLINSYNRLMSDYRSESPHNKKAFYDHLCALDFK